MISKAAKGIRDSIERDTLSPLPLSEKCQQWEVAARRQLSPHGVVETVCLVGGVSCLLSTPTDVTTDNTIVYCHGGGLVEGSCQTFRVWTSRLALHTGSRVLSIDYRLAPEHPYPAAVNDVCAVLVSVLSSNTVQRGICIGADSSGCNLALAAMLNVDSALKPGLRCAFFLSPSVDLSFSSVSVKAKTNTDPVVSLDVLKHCAALYAGHKGISDPGVSPLLSDVTGLPPLLVMADDQEILADDAIRLVQKVVATGGSARLHLSHGLWHTWPSWGEFPESTAALNQIRNHVRASMALSH